MHIHGLADRPLNSGTGWGFSIRQLFLRGDRHGYAWS